MTATAPGVLPRSVLRTEVLLVLGLSLGASAVFAALDLVRDALRGPLDGQTSTVVGSRADNATLDLAFQLAGIAVALVPVLLVVHLLSRSRESVRDLGLDTSTPRLDLLRGAVIAAVIGGSGLALYLTAYEFGLSTEIVVTTLQDHWWRDTVLVLSAVQNSVLEEVIILGYLMHRLDQLGWSWRRAALTSSLLRGSYHLYQGVGGFVGNAVMGIVFCWLYRRWGRLGPFVVAHALIDVVAFVGYAHLAGRVGWLP